MTTSIITRGSGVSVAGRRSRGLSPAFSRASAAYQSDGRKVGVGVPRFEMVGGRRGVLVEEETTNLVTNPDDGTLTGTIPGCSGKYHSFSTGYIVKDWNVPSVAATGKTFTYSVCMRSTTSPASTAILYLYDGTGSDSGWWSFGGFNLTPEWKRYTYTRSGMTGTITKIRVYRHNQQGTLDIACPQLEAKPYATSFVDGTRAIELLTLPAAGVLDPNEGTWEQWVYVPALSSLPDNACMFHIPRPGGANGFSVQYRTGGPVFELRSHTDDGTKYTNLTTPAAPYANGWHHFVATWQPDAVRFFIDGALKGSASAPKLLTVFDSIARVGHMFAGGVYTLNSCHSDLRVHRRALTNEEIAAHAVGNIVATDCYHYPFDGNLWPAPGSLGAVVAPSIITRPGSWR